MTMARTSFLEAVNRVLQMMGEAPINSLNGQYGLALQAQDSLNDVSRKLQSEGWSFNTDREKLLQRDASTNEIAVGPNISRVVIDPYRYPALDIVQRGGRLYDRFNNTYVFDEDLYVDLTIILEWEELPEHARQYITIKAGRQLQEAILGSVDLTKINLTAEMEAKALFLDEETVVSDHSMLRGNPNHSGVTMAYMPSRALRRQ
ncbi:MAG: hypothetical protein EBR60_03260 [Burkholderiaceae bacterium]|nr:hypothetical protein [Burkholderiaceae bacterium]